MDGGNPDLIWPDAAVLGVLCAKHDGQSAAQIALSHGTSRAAVLGLLHRVRRARAEDAGSAPLNPLARQMLRQSVARGTSFAEIAERGDGRRFGRTRLALLALAHDMAMEDRATNGPELSGPGGAI